MNVTIEERYRGVDLFWIVQRSFRVDEGARDVCPESKSRDRVPSSKSREYDSRTVINPVCGFSMMGQVRLYAAWPMEN